MQRDENWFKIRCGKVTASRISDIMSKTKSGYSTSRTNYIAQLVCERLTEQPAESYSNAAMQWGVDNEADARSYYETEKFIKVDEIDFVFSDEIKDAGASPDGLVGDDGLVEIKCPNTATHIDTVLTQKVPSKYNLQMQWQLFCTKRKWCDFVSYDPRLPENLRCFIKRVDRDQKLIDEIKEEVLDVLKEVEQTILKLKEVTK